MEYAVRVTAQAQAQMREIVRYVAYTLQAPQAARRLLDQLESGIASLAFFPDRIALTGEEPWRGYGIRKMTVAQYLVYFWVDETARQVQVTAVVYGRREQAGFLAQMEME